MNASATPGGYEAELAGLLRRADEDHAAPDPAPHDPGRHRVDLPELGLRCSLTRGRYPNRPDGRDLYVVTVSRLGLQSPPGEPETELVLATLFGERAASREERAGGPLVRMFRVGAGQARTA